MTGGLLKPKFDHRDYAFHPTFGSTTTFADSLNVDSGLTMPDQNADGYPNGCTGYAQSDICTDEDKVIYDPAFTYDKTLFMENAPAGSACTIRDSLNSTIIYGVEVKGDTNTADPLTHRRGAYYNVQATTDYFDGIRSAIATGLRSVSMATPWYEEFEGIDINAMISVVPQGMPLSWHNWKCSGWVTLNETPYLLCKSWQGKGYGSGGWAYMSRATINAIMAVSGACAFTLAPAQPGNVANIESTTLQYILSWLRNIVGLNI